MNDFNNYVVAEFTSGVRLCKLPFVSMVKEGDLIKVKGIYGKGKVLATATTSANDRMLNLLAKINPGEEAYKVSTVYSKKEIEWKEEEKND